jgi:hypothetical protein
MATSRAGSDCVQPLLTCLANSFFLFSPADQPGKFPPLSLEEAFHNAAAPAVDLSTAVTQKGLYTIVSMTTMSDRL